MAAEAEASPAPAPAPAPPPAASGSADPSATPTGAPASLAPKNDIEKALQRINGHKNVVGTIIVDNSGMVLHSTLSDEDLTARYAANVSGLTTMARSSVRELGNQNDLRMLRLRSTSHEIIVVQETQFIFITVQGLKDKVEKSKEEEEQEVLEEEQLLD